MPIIAISVSLLAIVAGMMLLTKTQKENLGLFFKYISIFVIIVGFLNIFAVCAYVTMKHCYMRGAHHNKMEQLCKGKKHGGKMHGCMWGDMKKGGKGMCKEDSGCGMENHKMNSGYTKGMHDGSCDMKNKPCAKEIEIEKDSVVIKRIKR